MWVALAGWATTLPVAAETSRQTASVLIIIPERPDLHQPEHQTEHPAVEALSGTFPPEEREADMITTVQPLSGGLLYTRTPRE